MRVSIAVHLYCFVVLLCQTFATPYQDAILSHVERGSGSEEGGHLILELREQ